MTPSHSARTHHFSRELRVEKDWAVLVLGGGPSGCAAAKAATPHAGNIRQVGTSKLRASLQKAGAYLPDLNETLAAV